MCYVDVFSSGGTSKTSMNRRSSDGPLKERSSRLRQVKSSYRRFLSIGSASTSGTSATVAESKGRSTSSDHPHNIITVASSK